MIRKKNESRYYVDWYKGEMGITLPVTRGGTHQNVITKRSTICVNRQVKIRRNKGFDIKVTYLQYDKLQYTCNHK